MDKLKKALSGQEDQDDEERGFVSQVLEILYSILYPYLTFCRFWMLPPSPGVPV